MPGWSAWIAADDRHMNVGTFDLGEKAEKAGG